MNRYAKRGKEAISPDNMDCPFLVPEIQNDVRWLNANSPDLVVDLALIFYIWGMRSYNDVTHQGVQEFKNWDRLSVNHFSKRCKIGDDRVYASLDRLVKLGILICKEKKHKYKATRYYKYVYPDQTENRYQEDRANWGLSASELATLPHRPDTNTPGEEKPKNVRKPTISKEGKPVGKRLTFTDSGLVWEECSMEEEAISPVCPDCGRKFNVNTAGAVVINTKGKRGILAPEGKHICFACSTKRVAERFNDGARLVYAGKVVDSLIETMQIVEKYNPKSEE